MAIPHDAKGLSAVCNRGISRSYSLFFRGKMQYCLEIITCDPKIYRLDHPVLIVCSFMGDSIGLKRVAVISYHFS